MAELVNAKQKVDTIRGFLEKSKSQIAMALPKHMNADRLARIAMTSILRNPRLLECTPQSLMGAIIQSAQLGLEPDDQRGLVYLVPFRNNKKGGVLEVQVMIGYQGLTELAIRSGKVSFIQAFPVYLKDEFEYRYGTDELIRHIPYEGDDPGPLRCAYTLAYIKGMSKPVFRIATKAEVMKAKERSRASGDGPWVTDEEWMWMKTSIRRTCKFLPKSVELATAVALDERAEAGIPQDLEVFVGEVMAVKTNGEKKGLTAITQALKDKSPPPQPTTETVGEPQVEDAGGKPDPVEALLADIASMSTRAGIDEFNRQLNKRLAQAEIKGNDILKITTALNARKKEIEKIQPKEE